MVCTGFTLYLMRDRFVIFGNKIGYMGEQGLYYMDGLRIKTQSIEDIKIETAAATDTEAIELFRSISNGYPIVVYSNHTCVLLKDEDKAIDKENMISAANDIVTKYGSIIPGASIADFGMMTRENGYLITCNSPICCICE